MIRMGAVRLRLVLILVGMLFLLALAILGASGTRFLANLCQHINPPDNAQILYTNMLAFHRRMDSSIPDQATLFIGDSITQGLAVAAVVPYGVNLGIGADTSQGVLKRIQYYRALERVKAVVLAVGVNDLKGAYSEAGTLQNYDNILQRIPQTTTVVFSLVLPVDESVGKRQGWNEKITSLNNKVKLLANRFHNVTVVDSTQELSNKANNLKSQFHVGDGLHLNQHGYEVWIKQLQLALTQARIGLKE